jgi:hypothetical protein
MVGMFGEGGCSGGGGGLAWREPRVVAARQSCNHELIELNKFSRLSEERVLAVRCSGPVFSSRDADGTETLFIHLDCFQIAANGPATGRNCQRPGQCIRRINEFARRVVALPFHTYGRSILRNRVA